MSVPGAGGTPPWHAWMRRLQGIRVFDAQVGFPLTLEEDL